MENGARLRMALGGSMGRKVDKVHYGKIWPNGNFSLGLGPVAQEAMEMGEVVDDNMASMGGTEALRAALAALTSSNASNSHKPVSPAPQRGLQGITGRGQQMLRSACYLLERDYGKADLTFATLTVPPMPRGARWLLAQNWSELVRQLVQWVCRRLTRSGRPTKVVGCTEVQSRRLESSGEAYLHLHLVWPAHSNIAGCRWSVEWSDLRDWWERALIRFSCYEPQHRPRVETAIVKKSAERYMGKYLSKGCGEFMRDFIRDLGVESVPPTWWFMSADIRHQVKDETATGPNTGTLLDAVIQQAFADNDLTLFEWIRHVEIAHGDKLITIGWCGRLRPSARDDLMAMLAPLMLPG